MKHLLWFAVLICTTSMGAERPIRAPGPELVKSTSSTIPSPLCREEGLFDVDGIGVFADEQFSASSLSFSKDNGLEKWKEFRFQPVVPGCFPAHRGMASRPGENAWLESIRLAPGFPGMNNR